MLFAHLSDLHINVNERDSNLSKVKTLIKYALNRNVSHFVITGDLSDHSKEEDLMALRTLFGEMGILNSEKLTIIVGNHDIFGGVQKAEDILSFPERCRLTDYVFKVDMFRSYFRETFDKTITLSKNNNYPFAKIVGNNLLIGINSILKYSALRNPFASNGEVETEQIEDIFDLLNDFKDQVKHKIVLIHHHFKHPKSYSSKILKTFWHSIEKHTMKLKKKNRLLKLFKHFGVDIVLHGHIHENKEYYKNDIRFLNAGASIKNETDRNLYLNLLHVSDSNIAVSIEKIKFKKRSINRNNLTIPIHENRIFSIA